MTALAIQHPCAPPPSASPLATPGRVACDEASALLGSPAMFDGAALELFGSKILVVYVWPKIMADEYESQLLVVAFHVRYRRTIVLVAQDHRGIPTYFGPEGIVRVLARLPFDALPWRRYRYKKPPQMLPIPIDPPTETPSTQPLSRPPTPSPANDTPCERPRNEPSIDTRFERPRAVGADPSPINGRNG